VDKTKVFVTYKDVYVTIVSSLKTKIIIMDVVTAPITTFLYHEMLKRIVLAASHLSLFACLS